MVILLKNVKIYVKKRIIDMLVYNITENVIVMIIMELMVLNPKLTVTWLVMLMLLNYVEVLGEMMFMMLIQIFKLFKNKV